MRIDLDMAKIFLDLLDPKGIFTFQTFSDKKGTGDNLNHVLHGTFAQHQNELRKLNKQGAGVFFMVNRSDGKIHHPAKTCRTAKNVTEVRALFADLDGSPLDLVLDTYHPHIIVETSPGKWHCYWITHDCPIDKFTLLQSLIAEKFDSDPNVTDLPRVLRVPGFFHQKDEPFMSKLIFPKI